MYFHLMQKNLNSSINVKPGMGWGGGDTGKEQGLDQCSFSTNGAFDKFVLPRKGSFIVVNLSLGTKRALQGACPSEYRFHHSHMLTHLAPS